MCGIAGIINFGKAEITEPLYAMSRALQHRGPDGEGILLLHEGNAIPCYTNHSPANIRSSSLPYAPQVDLQQIDKQLNYELGFAHRRLSIIDLQATGHQPQSASGYWICFNGEVYNYQELRSMLVQRGVSFVGNSDTEVVLQMYIAFGPSCVQQFNGMWALAIYDPNKKEVWLSRDRTGVKPLYYTHQNDLFSFASEQKALLKLRAYGLLETRVNKAAVFDYFIHSQIDYQGLSVYQHIQELLPGEEMTVSLQQKTYSKKSYLPQPTIHKEALPYSDAAMQRYAEEVKQASIESVRLRLRSDVPVGACLSGGIDSSSIVSMMRHLQPHTDIHTFTTVFPDSPYDESGYARLVSEQSKTIWHETSLSSKDLLNDLEQLMYAQDVPIWSTSTYAQFSLMRLAHEQGIKVVMDGQGGDELFGGYPHHQYSLFGEQMRHSKQQAWKTFKENRSFLLRGLVKNKFLNSMQGRPNRLLGGLFRDDLEYFNEVFLEEQEARYFNQYEQQFSSLNQQLHNETYQGLLKNYLKCEDRCSMHFGVESRTPFSDDSNLLELAFAIPSAYKIHQGVHKHVLREAMKGFIPKQVYERRDKMGYATPNNQLIYEIKGGVKEYFMNQDLEEFIDVKKLLLHYDSMFDARKSAENGRLFKFISFAVWMKVFEMR